MKINRSDLPDIINPGLGLDIDETLSWTIGYWVEEMQKKFGNPERLSVEELIRKYRYTQNVPYWNSEEALNWMEDARKSDELQRQFSLMPESDIYVSKIRKIMPIAAYITIRPRSVLPGTQYWLNKNGFPDAPIICRPDDIKSEYGNLWKAKILEILYPKIIGLIDDNVSVVNNLSQDYKAPIFLYGHTQTNNTNSRLDVIPCKDWKTVYEEVKNRFSRINKT